MMRHQQQPSSPSFSHPHPHRPKHRPTSQVQSLLLFLHQPLHCRRQLRFALAHPRQIPLTKLPPLPLSHFPFILFPPSTFTSPFFTSFTSVPHIPHPQPIVLLHYLPQRCPQPPHFHVRRRLQQHRLIPVPRLRQLLLEKPPLDRRQLHFPFHYPLLRFHPSLPALPAPLVPVSLVSSLSTPAFSLHRLRQLPHRLALEQLPHTHSHPHLVRPRDNLQAQNRISPQVEEVVVHSHLLHPQHLRPDLRQLLLRLRPRLLVPALQFRPLPARLRQVFPVQLPVRRHRQPLHLHPHPRHHVLRQPLLQIPPQLSRLHSTRQHHIPHQPLLTSSSFAFCFSRSLYFPHLYRRLFHSRVLLQHRLNLSQLDPVPAHLHLLVPPPLILNRSIAQISPHITRPVQLPFPIRIPHEYPPRHLLPLPVPSPHLHSPDVQLPAHPLRHHLLFLVQHVHLHVRNRTPDRHHSSAFSTLAFTLTSTPHTLPARHIDRRFRRPVQVVQLHSSIPRSSSHPLVEPLLQLPPQRFPAAHHPLHALTLLLQPLFLQERLQHRRHKMQRRHLLPLDHLRQISSLPMPSRPRHHQPPSHHNRPQQLPHRHIKTDRRLLQHHILFSQPEPLLHPQQPVRQPAMLIHRSLRLPRRPRRVNHVRQVLRSHSTRKIFSTLLPYLLPLFFLVHPHHFHSRYTLRQALQHRTFAHQHPHSRVLQHVAQPLLRILHIQRHVRPPRLQYPQHSHHHLHRPLHRDPHQHLRPYSLPPQIPPQLVRSPVQLPVRDPFPFTHHRHPLRMPARFPRHQFMHTPLFIFVLLRFSTTPRQHL